MEEKSWTMSNYGAVEDSDANNDPPWYVLWTCDRQRFEVNVDGIPKEDIGSVSINGFGSANEENGKWYCYVPEWASGQFDGVRAILTAITGDSLASHPIDISWHSVGISWQEMPVSGTGAKFVGNRVYPERESPRTGIANWVYVCVTASPPIPEGRWGSVHVRKLDPMNQSRTADNQAVGTGIGDNNGELQNIADGQEVRFAGNQQGSFMLAGWIDPAHAGDNWIIATHPRQGTAAAIKIKDVIDANTNNNKDKPVVEVAGKPDETPANTGMITVWRTLHVELDVCTWSGMPSGDLTAPLDGFVATELARACVVTKVFAPNPNPGPAIGATITDAEELAALSSGRDITGNAKDFWTVRILTTSKNGSYAGGFFPGTNGISILYTIQNELKQSRGWTDEQLRNSFRQTVLHEIGHVLIDGNEGTDGVMKSPISASDKLNSRYQKFLLDDIKKLQDYSRANN